MPFLYLCAHTKNFPMEITIPFDIKEIEHASFHPIVAAQINDRQFNMILDTGASRTVLSSELVVSFEKIIKDGEEAFAAGINAQRMDVEQVVVPSIWIGGVEFKNMLVFSTDLEAVSSLYEQMAQMRVDGLLGCDFLVDNGGIVDFNKQKIFLNGLKKPHK
jgi:hypothetical protein